MTDIEYGPLALKPWMQKVIANKDKLYKLAIVWAITTALIAIKWGYANIDTMAMQSTVITLDEPTYVPFTFTSTPQDHVDSTFTQQFHIKESILNKKTQIQNIMNFQQTVQLYLYNTNNLCIHARHFNVPYDIIIYNNMTLIDPVVIDESPQQTYFTESSLNGTVTKKKRAVWSKVTFINERLQKSETTLHGALSACFCHYEYI